jgi:hypothetical protein
VTESLRWLNNINYVGCYYISFGYDAKLNYICRLINRFEIQVALLQYKQVVERGMFIKVILLIL